MYLEGRGSRTIATLTTTFKHESHKQPHIAGQFNSRIADTPPAPARHSGRISDNIAGFDVHDLQTGWSSRPSGQTVKSSKVEVEVDVDVDVVGVLAILVLVVVLVDVLVVVVVDVLVVVVDVVVVDDVLVLVLDLVVVVNVFVVAV